MTTRPAPPALFIRAAPGGEFARGFAAGAAMMRERATAIADEEVLFAMAAERDVSRACDMECGLELLAVDIGDYWRLRVGVARLVADEIYHLPILGDV